MSPYVQFQQIVSYLSTHNQDTNECIKIHVSGTRCRQDATNYNTSQHTIKIQNNASRYTWAGNMGQLHSAATCPHPYSFNKLRRTSQYTSKIQINASRDTYVAWGADKMQQTITHLITQSRYKTAHQDTRIWHDVRQDATSYNTYQHTIKKKNSASRYTWAGNMGQLHSVATCPHTYSFDKLCRTSQRKISASTPPPYQSWEPITQLKAKSYSGRHNHFMFVVNTKPDWYKRGKRKKRSTTYKRNSDMRIKIGFLTLYVVWPADTHPQTHTHTHKLAHTHTHTHANMARMTITSP